MWRDRLSECVKLRRKVTTVVINLPTDVKTSKLFSLLVTYHYLYTRRFPMNSTHAVPSWRSQLTTKLCQIKQYQESQYGLRDFTLASVRKRGRGGGSRFSVYIVARYVEVMNVKHPCFVLIIQFAPLCVLIGFKLVYFHLSHTYIQTCAWTIHVFHTLYNCRAIKKDSN